MGPIPVLFSCEGDLFFPGIRSCQLQATNLGVSPNAALHGRYSHEDQFSGEGIREQELKKGGRVREEEGKA